MLKVKRRRLINFYHEGSLHSTIRLNCKLQTVNCFCMLKNFFKTTVRTLLRNKTYSFLNIFGLAVGIACTGLIFLWVEDEMNYDTVNVKKDNLYQVLNNWPYPAHYSTFETTPATLAPAIKSEIPGVA